MGFRLSSFLGGMAEGAIEIEEDVRKRNEKLFDATFETNAERRMMEYEARKAKQQEMDLLAKKLMSFEGMDSNKVNLVLDYGVEEAKKFIDNAPTVAAKKKLTVGDLIELKDPDSPSVDPYKFIREGDLIEIPEYTPFSRPGGLRKSPIIGRDYASQFDAENAEFVKGLGLPIDEGGERIKGPEGRIKFMDMLTKEKPELDSLSPNQVRGYLGEQIADELGVTATYDQQGRVIFDSEDKEKARTARQLTAQAYGIYSDSLRQGIYDATYDQDLAINYAFQTVLGAIPEPRSAEVTARDGQTSGGAGTGTQQAPAGDVGEVPIESITSPLVLAQRLMQDSIKAGKPMGTDEANAKAKQILDERKAASK